MTDTIKCISLHQPWASLVVLGEKKMETRSWPTKHRGLLLVHAAMKWTRDQIATCCADPFKDTLWHKLWSKDGGYSMPLGCIIGAVEVKEIWRVASTNMSNIMICDRTGKTAKVPEGNELAFGDFTVGRYAWQLANPRRFKTPITFPGKQQLFTVPREIVAKQLEAA